MNIIIGNVFAGYGGAIIQNVKPERGQIVVPSGQGRTESWDDTLRGTVTIVFADRESVSVYWHGGFVEDEMKPSELCFTGEYQRKDAPELVRTIQAAEAKEEKAAAVTESWLTSSLPGDAGISEDGPEWEGYCAF